MPFLVGHLGLSAQSKQGDRIKQCALQQAHQQSLQVISTDFGSVYAGYKRNEQIPRDSILTMPRDGGIFIGRMFDRTRYTPASWNESDAERIIQNPRTLLQEWWGRYVGVLLNEQTQQCTLLRDPVGLSTIYFYKQPGGIIFSSDLSILYEIVERKPSLHLAYFAEYIAGKNHTSPLMPFTGIYELQPGVALSVQSDGTISEELLWDISRCKGSFIEDENAFEEELLETMRSTLKAWVGQSSGICLELSGGTDSSGVMILLRDVLPEHKNIVGVNYIDSQTVSGNEIEHAQEVATVTRTLLCFLDWKGTTLLDPLPESWRPAKPSNFLLFHKSVVQLQNIAQQYGCSDIMNGQGGDHLFLAPQPINALTDYWLDRGFKGITKPLHELSSAHRMPWWMLMRDAAKGVVGYYSGREQKPTDEISFLEDSFHHVQKRDSYHLTKAVHDFYPAKKAHVQSLFHAMHFADRDHRIPGYTITHPLLSQPLVELAFKIPTYQSFKNGFDRIFFRNSISRIKKPLALWRTAKGETTSSMLKAFIQDASRATELVMQGPLIKDGLVNKQWFEQEMVKMRHGKVENMWPLLRTLTSQLWINQWKQ